MKDCVIIDRNVPQYKGNFHMHTCRSWDSVTPYQEALQAYYEKGYQFCAVTDHEVYWDSAACDREDFLTLAGVESAFILNGGKPDWLLERTHFTSLHINLLYDASGGKPNGFRHDQVLLRPVDYGLTSWNDYISYCRERNQLVIINHPNWSRLAPELFTGICGAFAFELWNSGGIQEGGCTTDEALWDYALRRGYRIWALTGDDTHRYGPAETVCGSAFTMVCAGEFSKAGLLRSIKQGSFYPSTGPKIHDMRIVDDTLYMDLDPVRQVRICAGELLGKSFTPTGGTVEHIEWKIKPGLKYFRVELRDPNGGMAWSQPVFPHVWMGEQPALREDPHTPVPVGQRGWQKETVTAESCVRERYESNRI